MDTGAGEGFSGDVKKFLVGFVEESIFNAEVCGMGKTNLIGYVKSLDPERIGTYLSPEIP